jgi:phenylpropionate dioxygenase-like ring-hydroxylating dioxygenase large terminal subunit
MKDPTSSALGELAAVTARPFEEARAMPPSLYVEPGVLELELEHIFRAQWLCLGRASAIPEPGDYLTYDIAGQPIFVIRQKDGSLAAFSNVCLHRMSTLLQGQGNARVLVCPYHAWSYNLDGSLRGAPHMEKSPRFCKDDYRLPRVRCEVWEGWIYATLDETLPPVAEQLKPVADLVARYGMADYVESFREEHVWDTNWKVLAENFMESYHLPMLHKATVGGHSRIDEMECPPGHEAFNYHWITKEATLPIGQAHPSNTRLEGHWRKTTALLALYPTHLITLTPGYFWYLCLHPQGVGKVHMIFGGGMAPDWIADPASAGHLATLKALLDEVNAEDRRGVEAVFRGMQAPLAKGGHLSWLERPNYDFARYIASRLMPATRRARQAAE